MISGSERTQDLLNLLPSAPPPLPRYGDDHSRLARAVALFNRTGIALFHQFVQQPHHTPDPVAVRSHRQWQAQFPPPQAPVTNPPPGDQDGFEATHQPVPAGGLHRINCRVPGCASVFKTSTPVSAGASFICKDHTLLDPVCASCHPSAREWTGPVARWRIYKLLQRPLDASLYADFEQATLSAPGWHPKRTTDTSFDHRGNLAAGSEGKDPIGKRLLHEELQELPACIAQYNPARWIRRSRIVFRTEAEPLVARSSLVYGFDAAASLADVDMSVLYPASRFNAFDSYNIPHGKPPVDRFSVIERYEYIQRLRRSDFSCILLIDGATWSEDRRKRLINRRPFVYRRGEKDLVLAHGNWHMSVAARNNFGTADIRPYTYTNWSNVTRSYMGGAGEAKTCKLGRGGAHLDWEPRKYILSTNLELRKASREAEPPGVPEVWEYQPTVIQWVRQTTTTDPEPYSKFSAYAQELARPDITEGIPLDLSKPSFQKLKRFAEIEYEYKPRHEIAARDDMSPEAIDTEYFRTKAEIRAHAQLKETNVTYNADRFDLSQLRLDQLEHIRREAGVYAMLPKTNRHVQLYRFPGVGDRRGEERVEAIEFDRQVLEEVLADKAFKQIMHRELTSKAKSDWSTGADLVRKAQAARARVRQWFPNVAIRDFGVVGDPPNPDMADVVAELEHRRSPSRLCA